MSKAQETTGMGQEALQGATFLQTATMLGIAPFHLSSCETIGDLCVRGTGNRLTAAILDLAVFDFAYYTLIWFDLSPLKWGDGALAKRIRKIKSYLDRNGLPPTKAMEAIDMLYDSLADEILDNHGSWGFVVFERYWPYVEETLLAWCESGFSLDFRYNEYFANLYQQNVS